MTLRVSWSSEFTCTADDVNAVKEHRDISVGMEASPTIVPEFKRNGLGSHCELNVHRVLLPSNSGYDWIDY